ncbi:hypothetical protein GCM10011348_22150 [Marinobacterium nitratireducens]|uniref:DUF6371 domain-containing protein n=1 Tax=Marinobacterium nitratireducens TaxID=518897 RepID=A0A917ZG97_9GAMM|nr:DUF3987 domain-containing protein [Marinobacterium nitratireducens]GGO81952.1 hypothetical protein GCM10011348_22150 [Marinobacterium nitratireducens]
MNLANQHSAVDFAMINSLLTPSRLVPEWLPDGKAEGREWVALNPTRHDRKPGSFRVNLDSGKWADFSTSDCGGDLISLWAYLNNFSDQKTAALDLMNRHQLSAMRAAANDAHHQPTGSGEQILLPAPATAPMPPKTHFKFGEATSSWTYRDNKGQVLFYVCRFDPVSERKQVLPLTYWQDSQGSGWRWKGLASRSLRPLYGLDRLAHQPDAKVLVCEGEKAADAAQQLFPELVAVSWMGGTNAVSKANWEPLKGRKVVIWPDNDEPGCKAAAVIIEQLKGLTSELLLIAPQALPDKADAADVTPDQARELLDQARAVNVAQTRTQPVPLPNSLPPVEPFDPALLPEVIRSYVMDVANRQQCAPDFCAVAALVSLAGVLGRKVLIRPKQNDDWTITPNLWGAMIGGPSAMKSPSLSAMRFPLDLIEREMKEAHKAQLAESVIDAELLELERKAAKQRAKKLADQGDRDGAKAQLALLESSVAVPEAPPRLIVNDATVEALGERLNENPNGLVLVRDELAGWLSKMQQDEYAADRAFYLECFNGDGRYTYDRIGRGTVSIEHCNLSIIGGIQPAKIAPLVRGATRGTDDDGLIQRFQLAVWPDPVRNWAWNDRAPDARAKELYKQTFYRLQALSFELNEGQPPYWRFTPDAQQVFIEWMTELQAEARSGELLPALEAHLLKMPKTICSLALLFAVIDGQRGEVDHDSTCRALGWARYLRSHAERLYSAAGNRDINGAKTIVAKQDQLPNPFSSRDIQRKGWAGLDSADAVREALELLVDHHYLLVEETQTTGRPKTAYFWQTFEDAA